MQDRGDPDLGPKMPGISSNLDHRISADAHQQIIELSIVLMCDVGDWLRQREDQMKISDRQQLGLTGGQPLLRRAGLAFGAMPIAARVVGDMLMAAIVAMRDMPTERRRSTALDS